MLVNGEQGSQLEYEPVLRHLQEIRAAGREARGLWTRCGGHGSGLPSWLDPRTPLTQHIRTSRAQHSPGRMNASMPAELGPP